ncbi:MAG: cytochrome c [Deltaproteobacteria bacterium]|nr:cytochrome c [Deltaproteobacteria bacterium]
MKYLFLFLITLTAVACGPKGKTPDATETPATTEAPAPEVLTAPDAAAGKILFERNCASCHGLTGVGDGPASAALNPKPRNLKQTAKSDEELKKTITNGGASVGLSPIMPAWGAVLSEQDVVNVIAHIRQLKGN